MGRDVRPQTHPEESVARILFLQHCQRMWEQLKQKDGCEMSGGGGAIISWARMNFEEEGGQALAGGLIAPREKTLIQPAARWLLGLNHLSPSSLTASVMMQMSSSSALSLVLREEDDGKRAGSVTEPDNTSASKAARKKGCHLFCHHAHRTRSCRSQWRDADHVEWRGRTNALSLCGDGEARGHWAGVSSLVTGRSNPLPIVFVSQIPGRKETGGREGRSRSLKRKLTASAERQDWNTRSASNQPRWAEICSSRKAFLDLTG